MGTVPRAGGERDRPGLPACHDSTAPRRQGHYTDGVGAGGERAWRVGPGGWGGHTGRGR